MKMLILFNLFSMMISIQFVNAGSKYSHDKRVQGKELLLPVYESRTGKPEPISTNQLLNPVPEQRQLPKLSQNFLDILLLDICERQKIKRMLELIHNQFENVDDYFQLLLDVVSSKSSSIEKNCMLRFIRDSVDIFKQLDPNINDIMTLHSCIFYIQDEGREKAVAALIKLKETFIDKFSGGDLIRLMAFGCNKPCSLYIEQLQALRKIYNIEF